MNKIGDLRMGEDLTLFEDKQIRHIYDDEKNKWYFSVEDIVRILTRFS